MQPYRKLSLHTINTILQTISLAVDNDALPVAKQKQRSAFPPNFVHSLDATHMLMTTMKMKQQGVVFAAVHDSYWTHAADVPAMNKVCRSAISSFFARDLFYFGLISPQEACYHHPSCQLFPPFVFIWYMSD
jgi:DNA-directed RNA polymerase